MPLPGIAGAFWKSQSLWELTDDISIQLKQQLLQAQTGSCKASSP